MKTDICHLSTITCQLSSVSFPG